MRQMGKRLAESGYSVLVVNPFYRVKKAPTAPEGRAPRPIPDVMPLAQGAERDDAHDRREGVHRVARPAAVGGQEPEDRHAGLLHGRPDRVPHRGRRARSRRRGRLVPRRRARAPSTRTVRTCRPRRPRRSSSIAIAENDDQRAPNEKDVLKETFAKANLPAEIEVYPARARLVPAGLRGLQRAAGREGVEPAARAVRKSARLRESKAKGTRHKAKGRGLALSSTAFFLWLLPCASCLLPCALLSFLPCLSARAPA